MPNEDVKVSAVHVVAVLSQHLFDEIVALVEQFGHQLRAHVDAE